MNHYSSYLIGIKVGKKALFLVRVNFNPNKVDFNPILVRVNFDPILVWVLSGSHPSQFLHHSRPGSFPGWFVWVNFDPKSHTS